MYPSLELTYASCFFGFITMLSGNRLPFNEIVAMTVSRGFAPAFVETKLPMAMLAATDIMKQRIADPRIRINFFISNGYRRFFRPGIIFGPISSKQDLSKRRFVS